MMANRAPSSSSITYKWTYDVFLSFCGDDTRLGFTSYLYHSLRQRGIRAFLDDEFIRTGEKITPALFRAIEESRIAIIVFSENYANSTFCLQELEKILECFKEESRLIYPVFYYVDPSELRRPRGSYAKALAQQEKRFKDNRQKVGKWRQALSQAADLKGCHLRPKNGNEQECITRITNEVATRINQEHLYVTNHPVGLVSRAKEVISCLDLWCTKEVKMIGIWGAGGIGKSTIARAVYNSIADNFEALCFLSNVRNQSNMPNGLSHLQETLLCKLVMEKDLKLGDYHDGIPIIEHRLGQKKILLVLDDVDESYQLEALAGNCNWFGCGSRIIITTRNKQLLQSHGIESIYDVKELNGEESLKLLSRCAFKKENMDFNYVEVCNRAVDYSCGFPLALEVIGSNLSGKGVNIWSSALDQFQSIPNERVLDALKLSYDTLGEVEKQVFLDLACFFNGEKLADVIHILLCVREIQPKYAIDTLIDKSLIKIEQDLVRMHDLIEDVGKEIVRQQSPFELGERSRLWFYQDILDVLQQDTGTNKVEAIVLDSPESIEVQWGGEEFMKMKNLKMLVIRRACFSECPKYLPNSLRWLEWKVYPFKFLPYHVRPTKLVYLDLSYSYCESLQPFDKKFSNLNHMNLRNCKFLQQIPNLSGASNLTELWLDDCTNLIEIHDSVGYVKKLRELSAMRCKNLKILPSCLRFTSLKHLNLFGCLSLQRFPEISVMMEEMQTLDLDKTAIAELPSSICNLIGLEILNVMDCPNLKQLPASIWTLPNLRQVRANFCEGMGNIRICEGGYEASLDCSAMPMKMEHLCLSSCNLSDDFVALCLPNFTNMIHLNLSFSNFTVLPECIKEYHNLKYLLLDNCNQLEHIGEMPPNLEKFSAICCTSLTKLSKSKVLKQAFNFQHGKRDFILPGKSLPERLHHYSRGSSVSFWVRNVSPTIFLWILVKDDQDYVDNCKLLVHINDTKVAISTIKTDHVYICAMQSIIHSTKLPPGDTLNQVTVSIRSKPPNIGDRKEFYFGVRIYNLQSNLGNIQFMDPCRYIIDFNLFQKNQEQEDRKELEEDMDWDLDSTKSAESIENPMHYQGGSSSWVSGVTNGLSGIERVLPSSKCLVVRELLDEVVNVFDGIKKSSSETKVTKESSPAASEDGAGGEGSAKPSSELSTAEKQDTQMKKAELIGMLDEVQQGYVQYRYEMQTMISLFEQAAGIGSARAYTVSPLLAMSRHFRSLKDAIMGQIEAANKSLLGEEDSFASKMEGSRLIYVNHQLRQERSVSVLRAWLLEHFLHPYPSDSDKHMLAKQTGLTTSQVSNWFINARVRLWKPMVEEMYLEEMEEQEQNGGKDKSCKSISEDPAIKSALNFKKDIPRNPNAPTVSVSTPSTSPVGGNARNHPGFSFMGTSELDDIAQPSPKKPRNHE